MTPIHDSFEEELRARQPAPAPARLSSAIAHALEDDVGTSPARFARQPSRVRRVSSWAPWGVAAIMTFAFVVRSIDSSTPREPHTLHPPSAGAEAPPASEHDAVFAPVSSINLLVRAHDEGVVILEDGQPARKVRYEYLDSVNLRGTGGSEATVNVTYPREEIRLVPVQAF